MRVLGCVFIGLTLLVGTSTYASDTDLQEAHAVYQEAGDWHAALPHAQAAYETAQELYGLDSINTSLLGLEYGEGLSRVVRWDEAIEVLGASIPGLRVDAAFNSEGLFEALYLLGRAQRHFHGTEDDYDHGDGALDEALAMGRTLYGENSEEVGLIYLEIGRPNTHNVEPRVANRQRGIVMSSRFVPEDIQHEALARAHDIFETTHRDLELAQVQAIQGMNLMILGRKYAANDVLDPAFETLTIAGYADDTMVSIYLTWVRLRTASYPLPRVERAMEDVSAYAALRVDGNLHPLIRPGPRYPDNLAPRHVDGRINFSFDVDENGHPQSIEITESDTDSTYDAAALEAVSTFRYIPKMINGRAVATEGVTYSFRFGAQGDTFAGFPLDFGPVLPPIGGDLTGPVPR